MFILAFGVDFKWEFKANISWEAGFPVVKGEGVLGAPLHYPKNWLVPPSPPLFCPKNVDFEILMQFLVILPKLYPHHKSISFKKP